MKRKPIPLVLIMALSVLSAGELTLEQARKQALESGWKIRMNQTDNTAREWQKKNVISGYLPNVTYGATLMKMDEKTVDRANMMFPADPALDPLKTRSNSLSHEISVSQPLTNGGMEIIAINIAKHTRSAQISGYKADKEDLILSITKGYFEFLKASEQKSILTADLEWAKKNFETAKIRFSGGMISRPDLIRWQQQVTEKEHALNQMEALGAISRSSLVQTMGKDPLTADSFEPESFETFEKQFATLNNLPDGSISENSRVQSLEAYNLLSEDGRKMAVASFLPKVNAFAKYSKDQAWDEISTVYNKDGTLAGGISLNVPPFSGGRNSPADLEKKYDAIKSKVELEQTKSGLAVNQIRIREMYNATKESVASAKDLVTVTEESLDMMNTRYNAGQLTQLDLLDMNRALIGAKIGYMTKVLETISLYEEYMIAIGKTEDLK